MACRTFLTACLLAAAFCACAEAGVVKVAINDNDGHPSKEAAAAEKMQVEGGSFCHNILCPNSTVCREVNSECQVCGFDKRCHSGSVCNNRCETNDQCGGECPSCVGSRCTANQKCSNILCNNDWDCRGNGGSRDCSRCGLDGVCHTDKSICGVACNTWADCGGYCPLCKLGQCSSYYPPAPEPRRPYWGPVPRPQPRPYWDPPVPRWAPVPVPYPHPYPTPYFGGEKGPKASNEEEMKQEVGKQQNQEKQEKQEKQETQEK